MIKGRRLTEMEIFLMEQRKKIQQAFHGNFVLKGNAFYEIDEECMRKKAQGSRDIRPQLRKGKRNGPGN